MAAGTVLVKSSCSSPAAWRRANSHPDLASTSSSTVGLLAASRPLKCRPPWAMCLLHRPTAGAAARRDAGPSSNGTGKQADGKEECRLWQEMAFPSYLQSAVDDFCIEWDESLQEEERKRSRQSHINAGSSKARPAVSQINPVWQAIRKEAAADAKTEPLLSSFLYASILSHDSFAHSLAFVLANRLSDPTMLATELFEVFLGVLANHPEVEQAALADTIAVRERDPACTCYSGALLYFKGYHAIQAHRISHALWHRGQTLMARALQSRMSEVFGVDVHPAARIGKGILLDHGIGVVIGETAVIGNNVSIMQHVTLGGTGKDQGDRHPKISDNVLIGASATVLGNITVGKGAQVAANSLVLKSVPPRTMVAGSPAKEVGRVVGNPALKMQHWLKKFEGQEDTFCDTWEDVVKHKQGSPDTVAVGTTQRDQGQLPQRLDDATPAGTSRSTPVAESPEGPQTDVERRAAGHETVSGDSTPGHLDSTPGAVAPDTSHGDARQLRRVAQSKQRPDEVGEELDEYVI